MYYFDEESLSLLTYPEILLRVDISFCHFSLSMCRSLENKMGHSFLKVFLI